MFIYKDKRYDRVWFTSDEHYGSERHITLSKRIDFERDEKRLNEIRNSDAPESVKRMMINSHYGLTSHNPDNFEKLIKKKQYGVVLPMSNIDKMDLELVNKHNQCVGENDIVFHVGDFGDYTFAKYLNGTHVLIIGNYEYDDCKNKYNYDWTEYTNTITSTYNFIDVLHLYMMDLSKEPYQDFLFLDKLKDEIGSIFIGHKPSQCYYNFTTNTLCKNNDNDKFIMNLFGHIHEKCKIKRYGLNVGVDCHHYYPVSHEDVIFYLNAILHHYDDEVFM